VSLSHSAVLVGSADCGDTSTVISSSSFGFFVLGPYGLLLGRLHFARKYLSTDDASNLCTALSYRPCRRDVMGLVTWFSCWCSCCSGTTSNHNHHPTRCRRRNAVHIAASDLCWLLTWNQLQSDCWHGWMLINLTLTLTFPRSKWFTPECAKLLNWFANTRKCVAFCDAHYLIFITDQDPLVMVIVILVCNISSQIKIYIIII